MNFLSELKRRNVYKVAVAYAVVGWLVVQVATQTFPFFDVPNWSSLGSNPRRSTFPEAGRQKEAVMRRVPLSFGTTL